MAGSRGVEILSRRLVRPSLSEPGLPTSTIHLTPWDLKMISVDYIQKGILLPKPQQQVQQTATTQAKDGNGVDSNGGDSPLISHLLTSFARALHRFFPLAGRLAVTEQHSCPPSLNISLHCNDEGAEFLHAKAPDVTMADIVDPLYIPSFVWSFFPLDGLIGADGVSNPIFAAQVTELADGIFIAMVANHGVADGTAFWHFFNTWSEVSRTGEISSPAPVLGRWFPDSYPVPIPLPFDRLEQIIRRPVYPLVKECFFPFSAESVKKLKAKANAEMGVTTISSLQSLLAHLWRSVTRARRLDLEQETTYRVLIGCRSRIKEVPQAYMGNAVVSGVAKAKAGEILERGLGWASWLLNQAVASYSETVVRDMLDSFLNSPTFICLDQPWPTDLATGSSPRFDIYGNDFGWGKPVAVRSGSGNKIDGKATIYQGPQEGSMALEVCLSPEALGVLIDDQEFMEAVSRA